MLLTRAQVKEPRDRRSPEIAVGQSGYRSGELGGSSKRRLPPINHPCVEGWRAPPNHLFPAHYKLAAAGGAVRSNPTACQEQAQQP